ncbi:hypothetical protein [Ornithinibacillus contaminans]|nr:hypothetical protein [Ornithinibacillus contaminans]
MKGKMTVFIIILFTIAAMILAWFLLRDVVENHGVELKSEGIPNSQLK